jgi:hypothetical protein
MSTVLVMFLELAPIKVKLLPASIQIYFNVYVKWKRQLCIREWRVGFFVDTKYGGVFGTSTESIKESVIRVVGLLTSSGSSEASAASAFEGKFSGCCGSSADTGGSGSSTGSLNVSGTATMTPTPHVFC